jgi:predicted O-linked N-acetylglucosamine transferase (SPINDLY family)
MSKVGRNDSCPCKSGKKYKQCCLLTQGGSLSDWNQRPIVKASRSDLKVAAEHLRSGRFAQAELICRRTLENEPDHSDALHYLGIIAYNTGNNGLAVELIGKAVQIEPMASKYSNLGLAFHALGQLESAAYCYRQALLQQPNHAAAHNNLGNALKDQYKLDEAIQHYQNAITCNPGFAEAYSNIGAALKSQGKLDQAVDFYKSALAIRPDFSEAYTNLLFLKSFNTSSTPLEYLSLARGWEKSCIPTAERLIARSKRFQRRPLNGRRLRVGYVSGDYHNHPVSYFIENVFAHHDRNRIELFAYSSGGLQDSVTDRLRASVEHWTSCFGMSDQLLLDKIEADEIDVLIDLSGHTQHERLRVFARRASPVQASYLGYFASTGLTEMDYWISDEVLTPAGMEDQFNEQLWRLPRVWISYPTTAQAPNPDMTPAANGAVRLGSFNNLGKLTPQTIDLWADVLHAIPPATLLLKTKMLGDAGNRQRVIEAFESRGIKRDRLELQGATEWRDYMASYHYVDIALDPVGGHSGGTISCDALWMGVPVIHYLGDRATSRFTASILSAIGRTEWICESNAEYIEKVAALAKDVEQRKFIRFHLREQMSTSPLCDAKGLAQCLEDSYLLMFERWQIEQRIQPL